MGIKIAPGEVWHTTDWVFKEDRKKEDQKTHNKYFLVPFGKKEEKQEFLTLRISTEDNKHNITVKVTIIGGNPKKETFVVCNDPYVLKESNIDVDKGKYGYIEPEELEKVIREVNKFYGLNK